MTKLSIIIPAWNEEKVIYKNLHEVDKTLNAAFKKTNIDYELIIVNDGSSDNTHKEIQRAARENHKIKLVTYTKNGGKGFALKYGFQFCTGDLVTFLDADLDLHPRQIVHFIGYMRKYGVDIIIGSKRHPQSKICYPFSRNLLSTAYHFITRCFFRLKLTDTQAGLKLFKYEVLADILPRVLCKKYAFDLELLVSAKHHYYSIAEAPVTVAWQRDKNRIKLRDTWNIALDTAAIYYRLKIKKYYDDDRHGAISISVRHVLVEIDDTFINKLSGSEVPNIVRE
jgi:glycosyltransferase involved in cell wall biosynthesis